MFWPFAKYQSLVQYCAVSSGGLAKKLLYTDLTAHFAVLCKTLQGTFYCIENSQMFCLNEWVGRVCAVLYFSMNRDHVLVMCFQAFSHTTAQKVAQFIIPMQTVCILTLIDLRDVAQRGYKVGICSICCL